MLLQGHGRRQAFDGVDVRHADLIDQAPGIGRHRFEVAALGFGVEGGEGQRGLARAGHPREYHQRVARDIHIDVLQVVLAGATNANEAGGAGERGGI
ncbi:multidrug transport protein, mfs family [Pseudomonas putida S11]|nr:multidrug transport protein, mfs family [Pseudomonas putida S11]